MKCIVHYDLEKPFTMEAQKLGHERFLEILAAFKKYYVKENTTELVFSNISFESIVEWDVKRRYAGLNFTEKTSAYEIARVARELKISNDELITYLNEIKMGSDFILKVDIFSHSFDSQGLADSIFP